MIRVTRRAIGASLLATPALAQSTPILRIGNQKGGLRSLIEISGQGRDLPYRIEWSEFPAAAPLLEALNANAIDLGTQGDLAFLSVFANGAPIKAIGATRHDQASQAILVRGDGPIRRVEDLRGKKVAGNRGGWGQFLVRAALKRANIDPAEVTIVPLGPTDASLAFRSGAVDGWAIWEPYNSIEIQQFGARTLVDGQGLTPSIMFVSAHEQAIRDKRPVLADFLRRFAQGWDWARTHIPEYARYNSTLTRIPETALRRAYEIEATRAAPLDEAVLREFQTAADNAVEYGLLQRRIDVTQSVDLGFARQAAG